MSPCYATGALLRSCAAAVLVLAGCGFDGTGSGTSSSSADAPTSSADGGPPTTSYDPNGDGGAMGTIVCSDGVLSFDGVNDVAAVASADPLQLGGDFTIEAWVKPTSTDAEMEIVSHGSAGDSTGWILRIKSGHVEASVYGQGHYFFSLIDVNEDDTTGNGGAPYVVAGQWAFVAATMQGSTLRVYYNGTLKGSSGPPGAFHRSNFDLPLTFGNASAPNTSHPLAGELDDVRLSKAAKYTGNTMTVPAAALTVESDTIALWHFDETSGIFLNDETGAHVGLMAMDTTAPTRTTAPCPAAR